MQNFGASSLTGNRYRTEKKRSAIAASVKRKHERKRQLTARLLDTADASRTLHQLAVAVTAGSP